MTNIGVLLVAHGSRIGSTQQQVTNLVEIMREKRPGYIIEPCFLEYNTPSISDGLAKMKTENLDRLLVVPLFLANGVHYLQSIPCLLGLDEGKKTGEIILENGKVIPFAYADPIAIDAMLADILLRNAEAASMLLKI